jgi:hypothetical protein
MARAASSRSVDSWPPEGLPLRDAVARLLPILWKKCSTPPPGISLSRLDSWLRGALLGDDEKWHEPELLVIRSARQTLHLQFLKLLLARSDLTLTGKPKDPWAESVDISAAIRFIVQFAWKTSMAYGPNREPIYDVRVRRKLVELEIDPCKSGGAGRPTPMGIIEEEASRRITSGEVVVKLNGLTNFARALAEWWEQERQRYKPVLVSMQMKSIRNRVRPLWNRALLRL